MSQDESIEPKDDLKQKVEDIVQRRREEYVTLRNFCQDTNTWFEAQRPALRNVLNEREKLLEGINATMVWWTLQMSGLILMSMDLDNEMLGLALTSQLDLINAMVKTSKELEHVARSSAETGSTKKQLAALSKKISSQTRRYKTVLELLELALQKDKERQEKLKEGLSYVE